MPGDPASRPPGVAEIAVQPPVRLWTALMIGCGAAALAAALVLVLGEVFVSMKGSVLEALIVSGMK